MRDIRVQLESDAFVFIELICPWCLTPTENSKICITLWYLLLFCLQFKIIMSYFAAVYNGRLWMHYVRRSPSIRNWGQGRWYGKDCWMYLIIIDLNIDIMNRLLNLSMLLLAAIEMLPVAVCRVYIYCQCMSGESSKLFSSAK